MAVNRDDGMDFDESGLPFDARKSYEDAMAEAQAAKRPPPAARVVSAAEVATIRKGG